MIKTVFLDRDGVINNDTGHYYIYKIEDFVINENVIESLIYLKKQGFYFIVISNQGGISKGIYTKADVSKIHDFLTFEFAKHQIEFLEIYYCPHHNSIEKCLCRKPQSLLFEKAIARFKIDVNQSFMIGDSVRDIEAAKLADIKGIKIESNKFPTIDFFEKYLNNYLP